MFIFQCLELLKKNENKRFLPTDLPSLDQVLKGGLPEGTITEVFRFCYIYSIFYTVILIESDVT